MSIVKTTKSPNGAEISYHVAHKVETDTDFGHVVIYVRGYATQAGAESGDPLAWMWQLTAPTAAVTSLTQAFIENMLVNDIGSPFYGGTVLVAETEMETTKRNKRMEIKRARDKQEFGTFTFEGNVFDSNQISQQRIGLAVQEAMFCMSAGLPFSKDWTLEDNSVVTLDAQQMIGVALAMGQHIGYAHTHSRQLRAAVEAATTAEEVEAINW